MSRTLKSKSAPSSSELYSVSTVGARHRRNEVEAWPLVGAKKNN